MKVFIKLLAGIILLAYIIFSIVKFRDKENTNPCKGICIEVADSAKASFITSKDIKDLLVQKKLYPENVAMDKINLGAIEEELKSHAYILDAECFKTADDILHVTIIQRLPVMRIFSESGSYFIDSEGKTFTRPEYAADVAVATGHITPKYAAKYLASIGNFLQKDEFWNAQVEQLNILPDNSLEMTPRIGNHIVKFGIPENMEQKFNRLKIFYQKVLNKVGWNKYDKISLEYDNQIVCTKKE